MEREESVENVPNSKIISYKKLFRFATNCDRFLILAAVIAALCQGVALPIVLILFGNLADAFINADLNNSTNLDSAIFEYSVGCTITAVLSIVANFVVVVSLNVAAENQIYRIRSSFFKSILKQDIAWYDQQSSNDFASRLTEDLNKIQEGIGEKLGFFLANISDAVWAISVAFLYGWKLTLVMLSPSPILSIASAVISRIQMKSVANELKAYAEAGGVAEEVLSAVRTVVAFQGQEKEVQRFENSLKPARSAGIKKGLYSAIGYAIIWVIVYANYALAFWYGIQLILDSSGQGGDGYTAASLNIIFFNVLYASNKFGVSFPLLETFATARAAATKIYEIIDRIPPIDSSSIKGLVLNHIIGDIHFENIHFSYPTRSQVKVLNGIDLHIQSGQTVALVGSSGCGKSTCIQLLQRFYDPDQGRVTIDNHDLRDLRVSWLRQQIGIVGQEPILFATTIAENIRYGRSSASMKDIQQAAREANADAFIQQLPNKYDTLVGDRGGQLSGGQKQRIAIARALVRNPKILLLDEATSALDTQSEAVVQEALQKACRGRTTIIVAHRLSTVKKADVIIVFKDGIVQEKGNHEQLMSLHGHYYGLVVSQTASSEKQFHNSEIMTSSAVTHPLKGPESFEMPNAESAEQGPLEIENTEQPTPNDISFLQLLRLNQPEWLYITMGVLGSTLIGLTLPIYAVVYGQVLGVLSLDDEEKIIQQRDFYCVMFLIIGIAAGIGSFIQTFMLSISGEKLTYRLRVRLLQTILSQEIAWFDMPANRVGTLCVRLSDDASSIQGATGSRIGTTMQVAVTIGFSAIVSIILNWKLGLVCSLFVPIIIMSTILQVGISSGTNAKQARALQKSTCVAIEAASNIRTVAGLGQEDTFHTAYMSSLMEPHKRIIAKSPLRAILYAVTVTMSTFASIVCYWYGYYLYQNEGVPFETVFTTGEALIFGLEYVASTLAFTSNYSKAKSAGGRILELLSQKPNIDSSCVSTAVLPDGDINFEQVHFTYPARKEVAILKGVDLHIERGQNVALVGPSGCGKSTCIQLLQRFYDPDQGMVKIAGKNLVSTNVRTVRSHLAIVSQEPTLFNRTIAQNIAYGDNTRTVPMQEIITAATEANIHQLIQSLPLGYDTMVGQRATQLSGGQKQRIAIARALVRNPRILLLDEATSALDSQSEQQVQNALNQASRGRTCITIAHRLTAIWNADRIIVLKSGQVHEQGTHNELINQKGLYYQLWMAQSNVGTENNTS